MLTENLKLISSRLAGDDRLVKYGPIDTEEAAGVLSRYISEAARKGLSSTKDSGGDIGAQIDLNYYFLIFQSHVYRIGIQEKILDANIKDPVIVIPWHDIIFYNNYFLERIWNTP